MPVDTTTTPTSKEVEKCKSNKHQNRLYQNSNQKLQNKKNNNRDSNVVPTVVLTGSDDA
jgi:hypothetical protein